MELLGQRNCVVFKLKSHAWALNTKEAESGDVFFFVFVSVFLFENQATRELKTEQYGEGLR